MLDSRIFDEDAGLYDMMRPSYPEALINDVIKMSGIFKNGKILEIGCGTGQATVLFARRGFSMLCLDIGINMIAVARRKCQCFQNVDFVVVSFEEWIPNDDMFDLVISATAFHWLSREVRYQKASAVLKDEGSIAIFRNFYPDPDTELFRALQNVYRECAPELSPPGNTGSYKSNYELKITAMEEEINASGFFAKTIVKRYPWVFQYSSKDYVKLLNTYSDHRSLEENIKQRLFRGIVELIDTFGGMITKPYLAVLFFAKKRH